jgi:zinc transporter ZupT
MFESIITTAYVIGLVSAVSLPMGAVTTFFWNPSERTIAILMAFAGGALLAALTIDMVASAVEKKGIFMRSLSVRSAVACCSLVSTASLMIMVAPSSVSPSCSVSSWQLSPRP